MINLNQLMHIEYPDRYKMHIAKYDGYSNPLDVFIENFEDWCSWNSWRGDRNRFNRQYIISFIDFYPQHGTFLFGGIFEVKGICDDGRYDICLCDDYKEYIGRLKVTNINTTRGSSFRFENYCHEIEVVELLDKSYSSHIFPGYEQIDYPYKTIKSIMEREPQDWKSALANIKGVYMLTDMETGKRYIGSAYGDNGIWSRWMQYCENGHGGDVKLIELVKQKGYAYIEHHFKFTLLEIHPMFTPDNSIILRENYWKEVMLSRDERFGYNGN